MRLAALLLFTSTAAFAQSGKLTTFVDCPGYVPGCDIDFFQTEIGFTRFVRDQADADVYVLIVDQKTGGGGQFYTLFFEGRRAGLEARVDTLEASAPPAASDDAERRALLSRLSLGLAGYASRTSLADRIKIMYDAPASTEATTVDLEVVDPWNSWVFEVNGRGRFSGESRSRSSDLSGSISARRVTEAFKVSVRPRARSRRSVFELSDGTTFVNENTNYGVGTEAVVSLTNHWSAGAAADLSRDTFSNYDLRFTGGPAVEYNLFPYDEATRRQLRVQYRPGVEVAAYQDTTLFLQKEEVLATHRLTASAEFAQPWGSVDVYSRAFQYMNQPDKYNLSIGGGIDLRLLRGLSLSLDGQYSLVRDQINLRAGGATDDDVLTSRQELATAYDYYASVGLSYSFGSIYNQVVNARFGG